MTRDNFYEVKRVAVSSLQLDTYNPRIRHGQDQKDCIARILRDRENFLNLLKDIAANGLSIEHILVSKNEAGKWVVRDGNRRITALKLLNRPNLALPDHGLVTLISRIRDAHADRIPARVNCMACDDEATISAYLERKHTGVNAGVGQKPWSAVLIALFNLHAGIGDQNRRAAQLLLWAEENGMQIDDEFPITTLTRGLSTETLQLIGFRIENDSLVPTVSPEKAAAMVGRVMGDIAEGRVNVKRDAEDGSIFTKDAQRKYFRAVRDAFAALPDTPVRQEGGGVAPAERTPRNVAAPVDEAASTAEQAAAAAATHRQPAAVRPAWERPCLFGRRRRSSPDFSIPANESKAISVVAELRSMNPGDTPIATAMLLRYLIELSNTRYRQANNLRINPQESLHRLIANSAEHMKQADLIDQGQLDVVLRYTREEQSMLHIRTLQSYVHNPNFHPNAQALNTFWDEIGCFVCACWAE